MAIENYQSVKRAIVTPRFSGNTDDQVATLQQNYSRLAQEVVQCHNRVFSLQAAVIGGAGTAVVILPAPFPDIFYTPSVILDWNAYGYVTAISASQFTITFSAAAPGGGGTIRMIIIR